MRMKVLEPRGTIQLQERNCKRTTVQIEPSAGRIIFRWYRWVNEKSALGWVNVLFWDSFHNFKSKWM
jgi:hypothetical protein